MKDKINIRVDPKIGQEIKRWLDQGYKMGTLELLKGFRSQPDIFFLSLVDKDQQETSKSLTPAPTVSAALKIIVPTGPLLKDGDAEKMEAAEPFTKPVKLQPAADPKRPTLTDVVNKILDDNKQAGLKGAELVKKSVDDITALRYDQDVFNACVQYLNSIV